MPGGDEKVSHIFYCIVTVYLKWINFRVDKISRIEDLKFSRGQNFANQPVFHLISFIFLSLWQNLQFSRGQNFAKMAKIRDNREN